MTAVLLPSITRVLTLVLFFAGAMSARAAEDEQSAPGPAPGPGRSGAETSGLPLPRFASLRAGEVNVRTGPGVQYPVDWVFQRQGLPVEVIAEYRT
ncbi:MAG: SH3 domain-containing protein, partial [Pseudomonadota bacterium]